MRKWTAVGLSSVATAALLLVGPAWAQATGQASAAPIRGTDRNVMITLKVAKTGAPDAGSRVYRLVAQVGGPPASMLMGWRMPIPTGPKKPAGSDVQAAPSFTYQNIGVTAHLEVVSIDGGRYLVGGQIEVSGQSKRTTSEGDGPPIFGTFTQEVSAIVRPGKTMKIAEAPDPEGYGTFHLELQVDPIE